MNTSQAAVFSNITYKARIVNAEFWTDKESDNDPVDILFNSAAEVIAECDEFLQNQTNAGMDYTADDIEIVKFINSQEYRCMTYDEVLIEVPAKSVVMKI